MKRYVSWVVTGCLAVAMMFSFASSVHAAEQFNQATLKWRTVDEASSYNIYFKETGQSGFTHAISNLPGNATSYTVTFLKKGRGYWYAITAVNSDGKEFMTTGLRRMHPVRMP